MNKRYKRFVGGYVWFKMTERYSFSLTTFSPSGKLVQIEYPLVEVAAGGPSVGIKASNGVVLAAEKKQKSVLYDDSTINKVEMVTKNVCMVYSGMGPDYRVLVRHARKIAQQYFLMYQEEIPTAQLVQEGCICCSRIYSIRVKQCMKVWNSEVQHHLEFEKIT